MAFTDIRKASALLSHHQKVFPAADGDKYRDPQTDIKQRVRDLRAVNP